MSDSDTMDNDTPKFSHRQTRYGCYWGAPDVWRFVYYAIELQLQYIQKYMLNFL